MSSSPSSPTRRALTEGPDRPAWFAVVQIAMFIGFAFFLLVQLGADGPAPVVPSGTPIAAPTADADDVQGSPGDTRTEDPPATTGDDVEIRDGDGAAVQVPADAVAQGRAWARALFTTDFADVRLADGVEPPALPTAFPDVQVGAVTLVSATASSVRLSVEVDPDGPGGTAARFVSAHVVLEGGAWVVRGA